MNGLHGSRVHLLSDRNAAREIYGVRVVSENFTYPCKCEACGAFVQALEKEAAARGFPKRSDGCFAVGIKSRAEVVSLCVTVDAATGLKLDDGRSVLDVFRSHKGKAPLAKECAKPGILADINGGPFEFFQSLVMGMQAPAQAQAVANDAEGDSHAANHNEHSASAPAHHTALVNALDGWRRAIGMTQVEAAEQIGLVGTHPDGPLSNWMRGVRLSAARVSEIDVQVATYLASLDPSAIPSDAYADVAPYLAEPSTMALRFARLDAAHTADRSLAIDLTGSGDEGIGADESVEAHETENEWTPAPTTRDHAELVFEIQKHLQSAANMSQSRLARCIGVSNGKVSLWLRDGYRVSNDPNNRACADMDARAAAYLADPQGVSERCLADEQRRQAAQVERERISVEARAKAARAGRKRTAAAPNRFSPPRAAQHRRPLACRSSTTTLASPVATAAICSMHGLPAHIPPRPSGSLRSPRARGTARGIRASNASASRPTWAANSSTA